MTYVLFDLPLAEEYGASARSKGGGVGTTGRGKESALTHHLMSSMEGALSAEIPSRLARILQRRKSDGCDCIKISGLGFSRSATAENSNAPTSAHLKMYIGRQRPFYGLENRDGANQEMGKRATSHDLEVFNGSSSAR